MKSPFQTPCIPANATRRLCAGALCVVALAAVADAQPAGAWTLEPRIATLDCGATVVMIEDHRRPMCSAQLWFRHARDAEPPDAYGLVDRMWLIVRDRLAAVRPVRSVIMTPDAVGLLWRDVRPAEDDLVAALVAGLGVGAWDVEQWEPSPVEVDCPTGGREWVAEDELPPAIVAPAFERAVNGAAPKRGAFGATTMRDFARTWWPAGAATIVLYGDFEADAALAKLRERARDVKWGEPPALAPNADIAFKQPWNSDAPIAVFAAAPLGRFDNAATDVVFAALAHRVAAAADARVRWRRMSWRTSGAVVVSIEAQAGPDARTPDDAKPADVKPGGAKPDGAQPVGVDAAAGPRFDAGLIEEALRALAAEPLDPIELVRARAIARMRAARDWRGFSDRAEALGRLEAIAGNVGLAAYALTRYEFVSAGEVRAQATALLEGPRATLDATFLTSALTKPAAARSDQATAALVASDKHERLEVTAISSDKLTLRLCSVPDTGETVVFLRSPAPLTPASAAMRDYCELAGIDIIDERGGRLLTGPPMRAEAMVEWLIREAKPPIELNIVGSFEPDIAAFAFGLLSGEKSDETAAAGGVPEPRAEVESVPPFLESLRDLAQAIGAGASPAGHADDK